MNGSDPPGMSPADPPDVKVAKVEAAGNVALAVAILGGLADIVGIAALSMLIGRKILPAEPWAYVVAGLALGAVGSRMRKGPGGQSGGTLGLIVSAVQAVAEMGRHG